MAVSTPLRRAAAVASAFAALTLASAASADPETSAARRAAAAREMNRPYMNAELGVGFLALPTKICLTSLSACDQGEASVALGLHNIFRYKSIGFGAGIRWATTLRNDNVRVGFPGIERDHSRRYFFVEGTFRYYAIRRASWEWWVGANAGGVIVSDSWTTKADRDPYSDAAFIGPRAATVGTEGVFGGLSIGGEWAFASNWSFATHLGYASWFLPETREKSPTGDYASLGGRVDQFDLGFLLAYRIAL
jgi:hypothetical protein